MDTKANSESLTRSFRNFVIFTLPLVVLTLLFVPITWEWTKWTLSFLWAWLGLDFRRF